jgi:hypothetical protein
MEPSLEQIRENYSEYSDDDLTLLAATEAGLLRPDVLEVLKEELNSRGLSEDIFRGVEVQTTPLSYDELENYGRQLQSLPCPVCSTNEHDLNATVSKRVMSFIIVALRKQHTLIACPDCLDEANKHARLESVLFGWWALPHGIIWTVQAILHNNKRLKQNRIEGPNELLLGFVKANVGKIEMYRDNDEELLALISDLD